MALMWKAAGGVKVSSTKLEASLPTAVSQRKRVHSFWKVPPGTRAWMDTTAKTQPPYHMLHDLRGNTYTHLGFHLWKTVWFVDGYHSQNSSCPSFSPYFSLQTSSQNLFPLCSLPPSLPVSVSYNLQKRINTPLIN